MKSIKKWAVWAVIIGVIFLIRAYRYDQFPVAGDTQDEFAWTWLGTSLWSGQPPTSWSWFGHYKNVYMTELSGAKFRIAQPVFDNPPLFSLIPGLVAKLKNGEVAQLISIRVIRAPMLILGLLNTFLLYLVTKKWFNQKTALVAGLFFATIPTFVFASRLVVAENLLITWLLLTMLLMHEYQKSKKGKWLYLMGLVAGLSLLTKVSGLMILTGVILFLILHRNYRGLVKVIVPFLATSSLWLVYAAFFGWDMFVTTQLAQANLVIGFESMLNLFMRLHLTERPFLDGWLLLGQCLITLDLFKMTPKKLMSKPLPLFVLCWLGFYLMTTDHTTYRGWYRYPMYPVMSIAMAQWFWKVKNTTWVLLPMMFLGGLSTLRYVLAFSGFEVGNLIIRIIIGLILGVGLAEVGFHLNPKIRTRIAIGVLVLFTITNIIVISGVTPEAVSLDNQIVEINRIF